ncbi:MAG: DUF5615 family PIN-like protein [Thermoplasmatota archaeon]
MRLIVDENIPPVISIYLDNKGHDVKEIRKLAKGSEDEEIVEIALEESRGILTLDLDFGYIYYFSRRGELNIFVLRPKVLTISNIKYILDENLSRIENDEEKGLYVLRETDYRVLR